MKRFTLIIDEMELIQIGNALRVYRRVVADRENKRGPAEKAAHLQSIDELIKKAEATRLKPITGS